MFYYEDPDKIAYTIATSLDILMVEFGLKNVKMDRIAFSRLVHKLNSVKEPDGFPHEDGFEKSSVFKKAAYFFTLFVAHKPLVKVTGVENIHEDIWKSGEQWLNIYFAYLLVKISLTGVSYQNRHGEVTLENQIVVSEHTRSDIIEAYSQTMISDFFQITCLLIEQMCYKVNNSAAYPEVL